MKNMIQIRTASENDISTIQRIAYQTWPDTYGKILSQEQLDYMMDLMYSDASLLAQFKERRLFFLAEEHGLCLGFMSIEHHYLATNTTRLHKLYMLPESQGKGIGKLLVEKAIVLAKENQSEIVSLNVNKFNKSFRFYLKMGFEIKEEEDLAIGEGYFMEDYKMEKKV